MRPMLMPSARGGAPQPRLRAGFRVGAPRWSGSCIGLVEAIGPAAARAVASALDRRAKILTRHSGLSNVVAGQWPTLREGSSRKGVTARLVEACQYDALDYTGIPSRDSNIDASEESSKEKDRGQTASL